ncbi:uncharacterized protein LOC131154310 [Malania oleifera]|uniref:uncharacterized protein LOC131154310 n=1 Tax=Malania oleifera TaxID=397392 RepID=UPI0025ADEE89|nr:uncharacterized protein LOC131154310 [Malania oleifera]
MCVIVILLFVFTVIELAIEMMIRPPCRREMVVVNERRSSKEKLKCFIFSISLSQTPKFLILFRRNEIMCVIVILLFVFTVIELVVEVMIRPPCRREMVVVNERCSSKGNSGGEGFFGYMRALWMQLLPVILHIVEVWPVLYSTAESEAPLEENSNPTQVAESEKSVLEGLPQDILVRILCWTSHDDLEQLFHVSKAIREATLIAKRLHFAYSTPPPKIRAPRTDFKETSNLDEEIQPPNAPKRSSSLWRKNRSEISRKTLPLEIDM